MTDITTQPRSISESLAPHLSKEAQQYIADQGAEVGSLSAMEMKLEKKAKALKAKLAAMPEAEQLAKVNTKLRQVRSTRQEKVTKITGVIENELGQKKTDQALDELFGDQRPKLEARR